MLRTVWTFMCWVDAACMVVHHYAPFPHATSVTEFMPGPILKSKENLRMQYLRLLKWPTSPDGQRRRGTGELRT